VTNGSSGKLETNCVTSESFELLSPYPLHTPELRRLHSWPTALHPSEQFCCNNRPAPCRRASQGPSRPFCGVLKHYVE
jgi:hypothetical protein